MEQLWHVANPDQAVQALLRDKLVQVEQRLEDLQQLRDTLRQRLKLACPLRPEQG
ncbi:MerR family DNA-binding protein [Pseudomonas sichuanensis]|uniref:MerR family DNA-binding protein n=1 Tax=Pseudomonas TaxID=286 RepID=UPI00381310A4